MNTLRDVLHRAPPPARRRLPQLISSIFRAGIVTDDPEVARRQTFTNIAAYAAALNALSHLVIGAFYSFVDLIPLHVYNIAAAAVALSLHRLHRYGENLAAIGVCLLMVVGHGFVVFALGYQSDLQVYFLLVGFLFFLFGVEHWRMVLFFYIAAFAMLLATVLLGSPTGFIAPGDADFRTFLSVQALINAMIINGLGVAYIFAALSRAERDLARQVAVSDALVDVMLPKAIAVRLKAGGDRHIADHVDRATVMFADLSGFTPAAGEVSPDALVHYLDGLFSGFDELARRFGVDKIKTIGDSYMVAGGLAGDGRGGAIAVGKLAFALVDFAREHGTLGGRTLLLRIGVNSGPLVAGVIGELRVSYDIWGDTVNVAKRLESNGEPGRIHVSPGFRALAGEAFAYTERDVIAMKGVGEMQTWFLEPASPGA
jgi:adenylate cyclase